MKIPFSPPYVDQKVINEVTDCLESGWITTGAKVKSLELEVEKLTGAPNVLCVNSATSGLMLCLKWFGVKEGDEVIVPVYTYSATALAVLNVGATPIMVDVNEDFNISTIEIQKVITDKTKVIIPVDIAGWPCDYQEIIKIAVSNNKIFKPSSETQQMLGRILVLSDAAHSIGAKYRGLNIGNICDLSVFSFHAVKNITTAEGGAVCINLPLPLSNNEVYSYMRCFSLNGQTKDAFTKSKIGEWRYDIIHQGMKVNMPDVLAAIGLAQIKMYDSKLLKSRERIFHFYNDVLRGTKWAIIPPYQSEDAKSSFHLYALRIKNCSENERDRIIDLISRQGVSVNVHYQPLSKLTLFRRLGYDNTKYPQANKNYECEISLPIYPQLTKKQLKQILAVVINSVEEIIC
jgi:dTDP-4-amino-4,6-dideoxygalactose transaminase